MNKTSWTNGAALAVALGLTLVLAWDRTAVTRPATVAGPMMRHSARARVPLPGGGEGLPDATGHPVPLRPYNRIVSSSALTDRLLIELAEPDRVLAFSATGANSSPWAYQLAGKATVDALGPIEAVIALKPDLFLMNSFTAGGRVAKLRAAGIEVFDLGQLRGLATVLPMAETLADLLGHPERGQQFALSLERRMRSVAAGLPAQTPRRRALYLAIIGPRIFGGSTGTSYHDVITHAGLVDAAAGHFADWPGFSSEQILELAPDIIVTKDGMGPALCAYPGMGRLTACRSPGGVIELPAGLLDEPGPAMLDAAEALFARAYPDRP